MHCSQGLCLFYLVIFSRLKAISNQWWYFRSWKVDGMDIWGQFLWILPQEQSYVWVSVISIEKTPCLLLSHMSLLTLPLYFKIYLNCSLVPKPFNIILKYSSALSKIIVNVYIELRKYSNFCLVVNFSSQGSLVVTHRLSLHITL